MLTPHTRRSTGAAANCVVSEQVLRLRGGGAAAHSAVRGSVPLLWTQMPDLSPKPRLRLAPPPASAPPFRAHMVALRAAHGGPVVSLSLLRARGREGALSDAFAAAAADAPGDVFIAFDFNAEAGASARGRTVLLQQARCKAACCSTLRQAPDTPHRLRRWGRTWQRTASSAPMPAAPCSCARRESSAQTALTV